MRLELRDLRVCRTNFVLENFSLTVSAGEVVALMGPSGCGKTTVLEAVCGMAREGVSARVFMNEKEVTHWPPGKRAIGLVPQDVALFPAMTVRDQLEFGPRIHRWGKADIQNRVEQLAAGLHLATLLDQRPGDLSGGQARRVALGRALAARPRLLCLDEAFGGLDSKTHEEVITMVHDLIQKEGMTVLHVTHSKSEAELLADRIVEMANEPSVLSNSGE